MTTVEPGFHPVHRLVVRLARISPHRQVQLLCAISVMTVVLIVAGVFASLNPSVSSLKHSSDGLVPAMEKLNTARENYVAASSALQAAVNADPNVRGAAISALTSVNSAGEAAWKDYLRISAKLPGERKLQQSFVLDRTAALGAGSAFVTEPSPTADDLANVTRLSESLRVDLNRIRDLYQTEVQRSLKGATSEVQSTQRVILAVSGVALVILLFAFGIASRSARSREERLEALDRTLYEDAERNELEARLQRSFEMAHTETAAFDLVGRALTITVPGVPAELLVADSSRAHFHQAAAAGDDGGPGCPVMSPTDCPAATWGQTQTWTSSTALDACPHLQGRPNGSCSAVCVPVSIAGKTVGVVHTTQPDMHPLDGQAAAKIELIARKLGERVGMLRAFMRSETQAHTDPLTGLMNRRSLEDKVREITEEGRTFVAAYGDLDHFKQLNDVHGHEAGDQALRLFSRVLRDAVRPNDLTARYGGEEFVIVLPECPISDAYAVVNRVRERLASAQSGANTPVYTVSFGLTAARPEDTFSETLERADAALLKAKETGRDRIVISGSDSRPPTSAEPSADQPAPDVTASA
ncbi:MAG: diguanylate cyclase [Acidimicrobiia bacterium]